MRCKNCKDKFEAKHFNQKYCFKSECVKAWVKSAKQKNWKKEKKELKLAKTSDSESSHVHSNFVVKTLFGPPRIH